MRPKILTVDDSKTVQMIIKKTFRPFAVDIFEAANGVEGLAVAAKMQPTLILLDITMPVMDGVEMLTRLKADPQLKTIPVVMLTAEGGRDHVLNIMKLGVRGYIVKPFKEATIIDKVGNLIDLKPAEEGSSKRRSILDPVDLLVVEDKPVILLQIGQGLKHTPWNVRGAASAAEATEACDRRTPDLIVISLSLPDDSAMALVRALRSNLRTKFIPIFALVVKTDANGKFQAQEGGFNAVVTKPIEIPDLEAKVAKALNLDTSAHYFRTEPEMLVVTLPANGTPAVLGGLTESVRQKLSEAVDGGISKVAVDLSAVASLHLGIIKLMMETTRNCSDLAMQLAIIGTAQFVAECKAFEETRSWHFHPTLEAVKAHFGQGTPVLAAAAA